MCTSASTCNSNTATNGTLTAYDADTDTVDGECAGPTGLLGLGKLTTVKLTTGPSLSLV